MILILAIPLALVALSLLILVHELGHFWVAKKSGIWVEEFGLGLPPRVWSKKIGETVYSINLLPIGGFVRLHGEAEGNAVTKPDRAFVNKSKKARVAVALAGVTMNIVFAVVAFAVFYSFSGFPRETGEVKIVEVVSGSPAQVAKLLVDDKILAVDGNEIHSTSQFIEAINEKKGERAKIEIERIEDGKTAALTFTITPREESPEGQGPLGVTIATPFELYFPPIWQRPFMGIYYGFREAIFLGKAIIMGLFGLAAQVGQGQAPEGLIGPFGIVAVLIYILRIGPLPFINFLGLLSVNLAILNLLPIPPLDGSRVLFIGFEGLFGKKILPKFESLVHTIGMAILLALMIFITVREIPKLISTGSITGFVESVLPIEE